MTGPRCAPEADQSRGIPGDCLGEDISPSLVGSELEGTRRGKKEGSWQLLIKSWPPGARLRLCGLATAELLGRVLVTSMAQLFPLPHSASQK